MSDNEDASNELNKDSMNVNFDEFVEDDNKKRMRSSSDEEWTEVKQKKRKETEKIELYISNNEKLPKQFNLAKLLKEQNINDITRVKFINPYRVRIELTSEISAEKLEMCQYFIDLGWQIQRAMEKNKSYGVIRDVDLDMSEEEILENISCPEPAKLLSVNRLNRRNVERDGWSPSEAVRLCFKGSYLPRYVFTHGLKIAVEPYVFPVSQCSRCWKFGHVLKRCPSNKVVCPKCGGNHANCEISKMTCVNCKGQHISLSKSCPYFIKEKRLRELMSEYNCTYRRALTLYVPKNEGIHEGEEVIKEIPINVSSDKEISLTPTEITNKHLTYAEVTTTAQVHKQKPKQSSHKKQNKSTEEDWMKWNSFEVDQNETESQNSCKTDKRQKDE
ncbi:hypothetical protein HW555_006757 [Spodoptera exigua]|uniref:CCHC-type domain-containing protein n=1 Tax=Spodoptera exigua TaxID=7107 RepID=A0A835GIF6_SPOEX|nr:hypothetical protein HW555_006757 [Spodoptera exigua]